MIETLWPRYGMYSAEEIRRGLRRSQFIFLSLATLMIFAMTVAIFNQSVPVIVACGIGVMQNLLAWVLVSRKHYPVAAALLVGSNILVAALHVVFLQPDSVLAIALSIYCINMLRATVALRKLAI